MKSITTLTLSLMMALSLAACWKKKSEDTPPQGEQKNVASMNSPTMMASAGDVKPETNSSMPEEMKTDEEKKEEEKKGEEMASLDAKKMASLNSDLEAFGKKLGSPKEPMDMI